MSHMSWLVFAGVLIGVTHASAQQRVIDQSSPAEVEPIPFTYAVGGQSDQVLYQTFTVGVSGRLTEVRVPLGCGDGTLVVEIRDVDASTGLPGSTTLRSRAFAAARLPGPVTDEFRALPVRPPLPVAVGQSLAIVLSNRTSSCGVWPGPVGDPYPGGNAWFSGEPTNTITPLSLGSGREDLPFETIVQRTGPPR